MATSGVSVLRTKRGAREGRRPRRGTGGASRAEAARRARVSDREPRPDRQEGGAPLRCLAGRRRDGRLAGARDRGHPEGPARRRDELRSGLAAVLASDMWRSRGLSLVDRDRLRAAAGSSNAAARHTDAIVTGRFARLGKSMRVDVELRDGRTGALLAAESAVVPE